MPEPGGERCLPEGYVAAIQGFKVGEHQPSCGRAAFIGDEVIVPEIKLDARWAPFAGLAEEHSIEACWSFPILSDSTVLGTLAIYHDVPRAPEGGDAEAMRYLATIASAAIGRSKVRAAFETDLRSLPVEAPLPPSGHRSGQGVEDLRKFVTPESRPLRAIRAASSHKTQASAPFYLRSSRSSTLAPHSIGGTPSETTKRTCHERLSRLYWNAKKKADTEEDYARNGG